VVPFQNCVRQRRPGGEDFLKISSPFFLICIIGQNRQNLKFIKNPVIYVKKLIIMLIQFKFGIMMSFLTFIMGFFMNFELLPILTDYAN
jgi:hypothetical protein